MIEAVNQSKMDENFQNYISFFKSEKYHSSSPISK